MTQIPPFGEPPEDGTRRRGSFESERWPRTPRVLRWAWGAGMTVLVVLGALGNRDPEARVMIRMMHELIEALDDQKRADPDVRVTPDAGGPRPE